MATSREPLGRSPTTRMEKHRNLYKHSSPQWRDTYRKRCLNRLRNSRENLLQKFRGNNDGPPAATEGASQDRKSLVSEVMAEEWSHMQLENRQARMDMMSSHTNEDLVEDLDSGVVLSLMEDIQRELMAEENAIIAEYESSLQLTEESLSATVEQLNSDQLICPICKSNPLILSKGVIFCTCGLRINVEQDCITLANVKQQLDDGVSKHSTVCHGLPLFTVMAAFSDQNLVISCQSCDFLYIVV